MELFFCVAKKNQRRKKINHKYITPLRDAQDNIVISLIIYFLWETHKIKNTFANIMGKQYHIYLCFHIKLKNNGMT